MKFKISKSERKQYFGTNCLFVVFFSFYNPFNITYSPFLITYSPFFWAKCIPPRLERFPAQQGIEKQVGLRWLFCKKQNYCARCWVPTVILTMYSHLLIPLGCWPCWQHRRAAPRQANQGGGRWWGLGREQTGAGEDPQSFRVRCGHDACAAAQPAVWGGSRRSRRRWFGFGGLRKKRLKKCDRRWMSIERSRLAQSFFD